MLRCKAPAHTESAGAVADQLDVSRVVNVCVVDGDFKEAYPAVELFRFVCGPGPGRRHEIDMDVWILREFTEKMVVDHSRPAPQGRELIVEHQDVDADFPLMTLLAM
jgi:hypothetical protein